MKPTRREVLVAGAGLAAGGALARYVSPELQSATASSSGRKLGVRGTEEYVWVSAHAHLALFVAHDHPALEQAGRDFGVEVTIAGPDTVDIPSLVAAVEQTAARKPAGMMVVGWDPSALEPAINRAIDSGVPVVCVDADVPGSKRLAFIGTDWHDLGKQQAQAMLAALKGRRGTVAMLGLIEQQIDQDAFAGFRSVVEPAGLTVLEPLQDKGLQSEAARVAGALLQAHPDLVGMAGFDSESGPGMGQAIKEAGKAGQVVATCVEAEAQHLRLVKEGVLTACIGQKRALFTYVGLQALYDYNHSPLRFSSDDRAAGIAPIPVRYDTGTYTVTRENVDLLMRRS
ncbi:MAG: substrate-binding domain-containing protein [Pirellulales bacterium]